MFTEYLDLVHCIHHSLIGSPISELINSQATLALGDLADVERHTTPFFSDGSHYQLSLESLSLGDKKLDIDPKVFAYKGDAVSGVISDIGAVLSYLTDSAYYQLMTELPELLISRGFHLRAADPFDKCFHGSLAKLERSDFPILSFNIADRARLKLDENDLFFENLANESICITVRKSSSRSTQVDRDAGLYYGF
ncbi:hypothetical protein AgCh_003219 [Apium graveolens]